MKNTTPRKLAKELGLKYYEGRECLHGHGATRSVANGDCVVCRRIAKAKAGMQKRILRGPVKLGRKRKYPILVGPPKPKKNCYPKPITEFDFWVRRNRLQKTERTQLPVEYYQTLFVTHCPLLGMELTYANCKQQRIPDNYATLDRIDPTKGYTLGNVQILSFRANTIKGDATLEELKQIVQNWENLHTPYFL
jgi:hypothetical protein